MIQWSNEIIKAANVIIKKKTFSFAAWNMAICCRILPYENFVNYNYGANSIQIVKYHTEYTNSTLHTYSLIDTNFDSVKTYNYCMH